MALVNHAKKEINAKIVYFGPAGSGKSTALTYIYSRIKPSLRGELKRVPAGADSLQFFDFSPFEAPLPNGYRFRLHVYTLTGRVTNPATWKMTLKGVDGVVIMVNPASDHAEETRESVSQLRDFLSAYGVGLHETPAVLQLNNFSNEKMSADVTEIAATLDLSTRATCLSNAASGEGLLEALTTLSRHVLDRVIIQRDTEERDLSQTATPAAAEAEEPSHVTASITPCVEPNRHTNDSPQIVILPTEVGADGTTVRIPLEISLGDSLRRLVVTVHVEQE